MDDVSDTRNLGSLGGTDDNRYSALWVSGVGAFPVETISAFRRNSVHNLFVPLLAIQRSSGQKERPYREWNAYNGGL